MAERYGFFNSVNGDRVYDASDVARKLKKFFTNGIFNNSLQVKSNDNMSVNISLGDANIEGYNYEIIDDELTLDIDEADNVLSRIDSVIVRLDLSNRQIYSMVLTGSYATNPTQPSITRTNTIYDLRLANISVPAGTNRITSDLITDTRFGNECGNVTQTVLSLNTSDVFKQYETMFYNWFNEIKNTFTGDIAGNLQNEIDDIRRALGLYSDTFDTSKTYKKGDLKIYNHKIYICNEDNVSGSWDESKWTLVPIIKNN